jgi:hypothetical protein
MNLANSGRVARIGLLLGTLALNAACNGSDDEMDRAMVDTGDATLAEFAKGHVDLALSDPSTDIESVSPETSFARLYTIMTDGTLKRICSGAMQTNRLMITARHCVMDLVTSNGTRLPDVTQAPQNFVVIAGLTVSLVERSVFHANGSARDLAGLRLKTPAVLKLTDGSWRDTGYIRPFFDQQSTAPLDDAFPVMLAGYGSLTPGTLRVTGVQTTFARQLSDNPDSIGVHGPSIPHHGDSGGPAFFPMTFQPAGMPACTGGNCFAFVPLVGAMSLAFSSDSAFAPTLDILVTWMIDHGF